MTYVLFLPKRADGAEWYLCRIDNDHFGATSGLRNALQFESAALAYAFAAEYSPELDKWRVGRRG